MKLCSGCTRTLKTKESDIVFFLNNKIHNFCSFYCRDKSLSRGDWNG